MQITCGIFLYNIRYKKILIGRATRSRNLWSIPKGLKEPGEDSFTAAEREFLEETGIDISSINIISRHPLPPQKYLKQNKLLEAFLVITDFYKNETELVCSSLVNNAFPEIDKFEWVNLKIAETRIHITQKNLLSLIRSITKD